MEKLNKEPIDNTNVNLLHENTPTSELEETASRAALENNSADDLAWSDIIKPENTQPTETEFSQAEFDLVHQQRDEILATAEQVRTGEKYLTKTETKELGHYALALARNKYLGPAEAEAMMINLAASTQDQEHSVLAHRTINEQFNLSSPEHRRGSHEIASRVIAMVNKDNIHPAMATGIALEEAFVDRYGRSSDESIALQVEAVKEKRNEDGAMEIHDKIHARSALIDSYGAAIKKIRSAETNDDIIKAGNTILNTAFEKAESPSPTSEDVIIIEAAVKILEEQSDKVSQFKSDIKELHEMVQDIVKNAPESQQEDFRKAYAEAMSSNFNVDNALEELSHSDYSDKIAA